MRAEFSPDPDDDARRVREIAGQIRKRTFDSYIAVKAVLGHGAFAVTGTPMLDRWARHRSVRHHVNPWMTGPEVEP